MGSQKKGPATQRGRWVEVAGFRVSHMAGIEAEKRGRLSLWTCCFGEDMVAGRLTEMSDRLVEIWARNLRERTQRTYFSSDTFLSSFHS